MILPRRRTAALPGDLGRPLLRNAYSLMAGTGITAVLGLAYWVLMARLYSPEDAGRGAALIAAMRLLAGLTSFGFVGSLVRFIPESGRATGRFIWAIYLAGSAAAVLLTIGFLLTLPMWGPSYSGIDPAWFLAAAVVWCVFTLQDVVLAGLRRAYWVPVGSVAFGLAKIALLVALASAAPRDGVFLSWVIPTAVALVPVNLLIFTRLVPRHVRETAGVPPPPARRVGRFLAGDYLGTMFNLAIVYLLPVIVATRIPSETYAYYNSVVVLCGMLDMLSLNMATSLTVEGAFDRTTLAANLRRALTRIMAILLPVVAVLALFAPFVLSVYGTAYTDNASALLRLMALATLPRALVELYLGALRAQSRARRIWLVQALMSVLVIGSTLALLPVAGITGAGVALLVSQAAVALVVFPGLRGTLRPPARSGLPGEGAQAA
ncbi:lipopolysaccharide biosynthesis protein [Bailinhaonella thermotolerans]|uniref:Lipopolysaccharide biosynthesis protein n=1 Tax=Bailinhaonella thermotolerans TaxID=1070861 RepID=A0A3A4BNM8_9ACTN|nr:lipopolysaccharide biosynthesis protein [Bailinhaonella thermotolerans]RJL32654.1 lipopolysaccharide biosynthesis protein [Bailinhaonella thermotolerans]